MERFEIDKDFSERWIDFIHPPNEKVTRDKITFFYQRCYLMEKDIICMDGGRFQMPLPQIVWDYEKINKFLQEHKTPPYPLDDHPVKQVVLSKLDYHLCNIFTPYGYSVDEYLQVLREKNKLTILEN